MLLTLYSLSRGVSLGASADSSYFAFIDPSIKEEGSFKKKIKEEGNEPARLGATRYLNELARRVNETSRKTSS
jgi:hypothetical protein